MKKTKRSKGGAVDRVPVEERISQADRAFIKKQAATIIRMVQMNYVQQAQKRYQYDVKNYFYDEDTKDLFDQELLSVLDQVDKPDVPEVDEDPLPAPFVAAPAAAPAEEAPLPDEAYVEAAGKEMNRLLKNDSTSEALHLLHEISTQIRGDPHLRSIFDREIGNQYLTRGGARKKRRTRRRTRRLGYTRAKCMLIPPSQTRMNLAFSNF